MTAREADRRFSLWPAVVFVVALLATPLVLRMAIRGTPTLVVPFVVATLAGVCGTAVDRRVFRYAGGGVLLGVAVSALWIVLTIVLFSGWSGIDQVD